MHKIDYKVKYEKALNRAKGLYCDGAPDSLHLVSIFPELAESEDERTRKGLIHLVEKSNEYGGYALHKDEADRMIAWIEKKGVPQPKQELSEEDVIKKHITNDSLSDAVNARLLQCGWPITSEFSGEVIEKLKRLGWDMYYAYQGLTNDTSRIRKAMEAWWKYINYELNKGE